MLDSRLHLWLLLSFYGRGQTDKDYLASASSVLDLVRIRDLPGNGASIDALGSRCGCSMRAYTTGSNRVQAGNKKNIV
jgi:hypothetical protein